MNANANINIKKVDIKKFGDKGKINIHYTGVLKDYPTLNVSGKSVLVDIPGAKVSQKINKAFNFATANSKDTQIQAVQKDANTIKFKANLPYSLTKDKDKISLMIKDNKIELVVPHKKMKETVAKAVAKKPVAKTTMLEAQKKKFKERNPKTYLNEKYLEKLIKENGEVVVKPSPNQVDTVNTKAAKSQAPKTTSNQSISFIEYAGKFVAFLGVVLLLFYGVITLMKKGFIKKGKLGFLNKTDQIQVLSQTYIAPKKSLMMIKAHDQVFLVSNTEAGIHPISEMKNPMGILKAGEKEVAGTNFDESVFLADSDEALDKKITLKKDITQSNKESSLSSYIGIKDQVKFSDQIKKKVKGLKPLQ
tara:strand:+ start:24408 stop:25493 length:1086 start_codon:yes stop_codon:yes gene_type:complete